MSIMRRTLWLGVLLLPLWASPARAQYPGPGCGIFKPVEFDWGINIRFNVHALDYSHLSNVGPWYLYWPYDGCRQTMAQGYPNWPAPAPLPAPPAGGPPAAPPAAPLPGPKMPGADPTGPVLTPQASYYFTPTPAAVQPVAYRTALPGYWFGR
jgi:hypothetical protein